MEDSKSATYLFLLGINLTYRFPRTSELHTVTDTEIGSVAAFCARSASIADSTWSSSHSSEETPTVQGQNRNVRQQTRVAV